MRNREVMVEGRGEESGEGEEGGGEEIEEGGE